MKKALLVYNNASDDFGFISTYIRGLSPAEIQFTVGHLILMDIDEWWSLGDDDTFELEAMAPDGSVQPDVFLENSQHYIATHPTDYGMVILLDAVGDSVIVGATDISISEVDDFSCMEYSDDPDTLRTVISDNIIDVVTSVLNKRDM